MTKAGEDERSLHDNFSRCFLRVKERSSFLGRKVGIQQETFKMSRKKIKDI